MKPAAQSRALPLRGLHTVPEQSNEEKELSSIPHGPRGAGENYVSGRSSQDGTVGTELSFPVAALLDRSKTHSDCSERLDPAQYWQRDSTTEFHPAVKCD